MNLIISLVMAAPMLAAIYLTITFFNLRPETIKVIIPPDNDG